MKYVKYYEDINNIDFNDWDDEEMDDSVISGDWIPVPNSDVLKIGDKVIISNNSPWKHQATMDGYKVIGVVNKIYGNRGYGYNIWWDNGNRGFMYNHSDLLYQPSILENKNMKHGLLNENILHQFNILRWVDKWKNKLNLNEWSIDTISIDDSQVLYPPDIHPTHKYFIGIQYNQDSKEGTIYHGRNLIEEDIVHELLHASNPKKPENWVEEQTNKLVNKYFQNQNLSY